MNTQVPSRWRHKHLWSWVCLWSICVDFNLSFWNILCSAQMCTANIFQSPGYFEGKDNTGRTFQEMGSDNCRSQLKSTKDGHCWKPKRSARLTCLAVVFASIQFYSNILVRTCNHCILLVVWNARWADGCASSWTDWNAGIFWECLQIE